MEVYLWKDRTRVTADMTVTHAMVKRLTRKVEGYGHKLYMDIFSSPDLFDDCLNRKSTAAEQYDLRGKECHMT
jgi:hypothetical protein